MTCLPLNKNTMQTMYFIKAGGGTEPARGGPVGPQQTPLHDAGAERGSAREEPAEGATYGGPGGAAAVQEVLHVTLFQTKVCNSLLTPLNPSRPGLDTLSKCLNTMVSKS